MTFLLVALGALIAVGVELLEALAIVLAVGVSRRWRACRDGLSLTATPRDPPARAAWRLARG